MTAPAIVKRAKQKAIRQPKAQPSPLEELLAWQIRVAGLPEPVREYMYGKPVKRKWRADFAYPERKIIIECEGGTYSRGRHVRPLGYERDCEKYNWASILGYKVLRFTSNMIKSGEALNVIEFALKGDHHG